jgi:hypothetical protein
MQVSAPEHVTAAVLDKLLRDLIAARPEVGLPDPVT